MKLIQCKLTVRGMAAQIAKFVEAAKGEDGLGMPTDFALAYLVPPAVSPIPHGWRTANWGTEHELECLGTESRRDDMDYDLEAADTPPDLAFKTFSNKYPRLHFTLAWREEGARVMGVATYQAGVENTRVFKPLPQDEEDED